MCQAPRGHERLRSIAICGVTRQITAQELLFRCDASAIGPTQQPADKNCQGTLLEASANPIQVDPEDNG
jgi:hypothetical protein